MDPKLFPKEFLWGASTASHQVDGGTVNQWSVWELQNANELARGAEERLGSLLSWQDIKADAQNPNNYVSGRGVDHYNRYEEDFDLLLKLNFNSFRFSIEWSRIEPEEGVWNDEALEHYSSYIAALKKRGLEPILNLWHWTLPTWFTDKGGFEKKSNLVYFDRLVEKVAEEYGEDIKYFITLNEPNVYTSFSYFTGEWPPQLKQPLKGLKVYWNLAQAHKRAYKLLKTTHPSIKVGIAAQLSNIQAYRATDPLARLGNVVRNYFWNWWFLDRIKKHQDFVGVNYYFTNYYDGLSLLGTHNPKVPVSDLGSYMEPEGVFPLLMRVNKRYKQPIMITENGLADSRDKYRSWWIEQTLMAMQRALSQGVNVIGYLHWSLLDNFEWSYGWWPKFGLVSVDRNNGMKRSIRPSAEWYSVYLSKLLSRTPEKEVSKNHENNK